MGRTRAKPIIPSRSLWRCIGAKARVWPATNGRKWNRCRPGLESCRFAARANGLDRNRPSGETLGWAHKNESEEHVRTLKFWQGLAGTMAAWFGINGIIGDNQLWARSLLQSEEHTSEL